MSKARVALNLIETIDGVHLSTTASQTALSLKELGKSLLLEEGRSFRSWIFSGEVTLLLTSIPSFLDVVLLLLVSSETISTVEAKTKDRNRVLSLKLEWHRSDFGRNRTLL